MPAWVRSPDHVMLAGCTPAPCAAVQSVLALKPASGQQPACTSDSSMSHVLEKRAAKLDPMVKALHTICTHACPMTRTCHDLVCLELDWSVTSTVRGRIAHTTVTQASSAVHQEWHQWREALSG